MIKLLEQTEVHVWQTSAKAGSPLNSNLFNLLSAEEKTKVMKYRYGNDQERFIKFHGILRCILAAYTGSDPKEVRYEYTKFGKPVLVNLLKGNEIHFNMTHAEDNVFYIVSSKYEVGIDLEKVTECVDWQNISRQYFSLQERNFIESVPRDQRTHAFFYIWTRKEALLKAKGVGLFGIETMEESVLSQVHRKHALFSFRFEENYYCSLAISPMISRIKYFRLHS
jgi:4'-phosphopantetheinyl transferase